MEFPRPESADAGSGIRSERIMLGTVFGFQSEANLSFPADVSTGADSWHSLPLIA